jgi:flagellar biosynthetic protein FliP
MITEYFRKFSCNKIKSRFYVFFTVLFFFLYNSPAYSKQESLSIPAIEKITSQPLTNNPLFSLNIASGDSSDDFAPAIKIVAVLTLLTFGPAILLLMSSFTRIIIVLSFLRQALGSPTLPPNQILIGLSLFLTYFVMSPTITKIYDNSLIPYMNKQINTETAIKIAQEPIKNFMLLQTRNDDLALFYRMSRLPSPAKKEDISMSIIVPAFVISELKIAFQIGFLVFLPFIVIDMIVSSVLMAMGMMMLPPTVVSLPLKIILFVLVDGWNLIAGSLIRSFV